MLAVLLSVGVIGCADEPDTTSETVADEPAELRVDLRPGGFDLHWDPPTAADHDRQIQWRSRAHQGRSWAEPGPWQDLAANRTGAMLEDAHTRTRYEFRTRTGDGAWSEPTTRLYAEPTLPVVRLDTGGAELDHGRGGYRLGRFALEEDPTRHGSPATPVGIRERGSSTRYFVENKKSYQIKFETPRPMLDMPAAQRWVLLANPFDRSQLRNHAAFELARAAGQPWVPSCTWVELTLDGDYRGIYQLCEKVETGPDRVDIDEPGPGDDPAGGYLLKLETIPDGGDPTAWTTPASGQSIIVDRPKDPTADQLAWVQDHLDRFDRVLTGDDFADPDHGYRDWVDLDSVISYWIVQEITLDDDGYHASTWFQIPRDDHRLHFGPVWDFDRSMGSEVSKYDPTTTGWYAAHPDSPLAAHRPWVVRMFEDPALVAEAVARWQRVRPALERVPAQILTVAEDLEPAKANDLLRWEDEGHPEWNYRYGDDRPSDTPTFLARWLTERIAWIDANLATFDAHDDPGPMVPGRAERLGNRDAVPDGNP